MKTILMVIFLAVSSQAMAGINWDQCYQLYMPGAMYPMVCLEGTNEEAINGAGVRMVIFHTNTNLISACALSSSLAGTGSSLEFMLGEKKEMILSNVVQKGADLLGDATFGRTTLKFMTVNASHRAARLAVFHAEPKCRSLGMGNIVKLR